MDEYLIINLLFGACEIYKSASFQDHSGHWDPTMKHGAGCQECKRAQRLRGEADAIMNTVNELMGETQ